MLIIRTLNSDRSACLRRTQCPPFHTLSEVVNGRKVGEARIWLQVPSDSSYVGCQSSVHLAIPDEMAQPFSSQDA